MLQQSLIYSNVTALQHSTIVATVVYQPRTGRVDGSAWCGTHAIVIGLGGAFEIEDQSATIVPQDTSQADIHIKFDFVHNEVIMNVQGLVKDLVLVERSPRTVLDMVFLSESVDQVENVNTLDLMTTPGRTNLLSVPRLSRGTKSTLIGSYTFSSLQADTHGSSINVSKEAIVALLDLDSRRWWVRGAGDLPLAHVSRPWNISITSPDEEGDWCRASFYVCQGQNPVLYSSGSCAQTMRVGCQLLFNPLAGTATLNMSLGGTLRKEITLFPISEALLIPIMIASGSQTN